MIPQFLFSTTRRIACAQHPPSGFRVIPQMRAFNGTEPGFVYRSYGMVLGGLLHLPYRHHSWSLLCRISTLIPSPILVLRNCLGRHRLLVSIQRNVKPMKTASSITATCESVRPVSAAGWLGLLPCV